MASIDQLKRALADYQTTLDLIENGAYRPARNGIDITEETRAKARRGIAEARAILANT